MNDPARQDAVRSFSLSEARGHVRDLFRPSPVIFWSDFLLSMIIGGAAFAMISRTPRWSVWQALAFFVCAAAYYRATIFTHELTHLPTNSWKGFRVAWNLLCGIPFLMPSFTYYTHIDHHRRKHYGTRRDGEYLSLGAQPPHKTLLYLAQSLVVGPLAVLRFGLITPLCWVSPTIRNYIAQHASSMVMDPTYIRPLPTAKVRRIWKIQEALCFAWVVGVAVVYFNGVLPLSGGKPIPADFIPKIYLLSVAIMFTNSIRTLAAHRYLGHDDTEMTFNEQLLDSVNHPGKPLIGGLWAPVGQRFHALHHLFPSMPYHSLAKAHARLMEKLPEDSVYRLTESHSILATLGQLWSQTRNRPRGAVTSTVPSWHVGHRAGQTSERELETSAFSEN